MGDYIISNPPIRTLIYSQVPNIRMTIQEFIELSRVYVWPVLIFIILLMYGEYIRKTLDRIIQGPLHEVITSVATLKFGAKEIVKSPPGAGMSTDLRSYPVDPECTRSLLVNMASYDLRHFLKIANKQLTIDQHIGLLGMLLDEFTSIPPMDEKTMAATFLGYLLGLNALDGTIIQMEGDLADDNLVIHIRPEVIALIEAELQKRDGFVLTPNDVRS